MTKARNAWRAATALLTIVAVTTTLFRPLYAQGSQTAITWGGWNSAAQRPAPLEASAAESPNDGEPAGQQAASADQEESQQWMWIYSLWQWGISSLSGLGPISPIHGRIEALTHADEIRHWAPDDLELIVAASIAHQASDFKDRPFGTDALELLWRELVDENISVGIAQLRQAEVLHWAPYLYGSDLLSPEAAIRIMVAKLSQANAYILRRYPHVSDTDRFMLLALAQNTSSHAAMRSTVDHFFAASENWSEMLAGDEALQRNWRLQLRLVLVHLDWLVRQGWSLPDGLDLLYWSRIAFSEPR